MCKKISKWGDNLRMKEISRSGRFHIIISFLLLLKQFSGHIHNFYFWYIFMSQPATLWTTLGLGWYGIRWYVNPKATKNGTIALHFSPLDIIPLSPFFVSFFLYTPSSLHISISFSIHLFPSLLHMMTSWNGNIFRVTGHLCGEFTGPRWIPHTKASDAEHWCFLWFASE